MASICVFCGANPGNDPAFLAAATALGQAIAAGGHRLVYGGGRVGLMGAIADAALARGGEVVGFIPHGLVEREVGHRELTELIVTDSMHARKAGMADVADGFVALPGGYGTLDEAFEVVTLVQNGKLERFPIVGMGGEFWHHLRHFARETMLKEGVISSGDLDFIHTAASPDEALQIIQGR